MRKNWIARMLRLIFSVTTIAICILFIIGCLLPWISAKTFWIGGLIGLIFPYITLSLILIIFCWLFISKKITYFLIFLIFIGYKQIKTICAININETFTPTKSQNNIRIISWNIAYLSGKPLYTTDQQHSEVDVVSSIFKQNADIICLQEFQECNNGCKGLDLIKRKYPYYYLSSWDHKYSEVGSIGAIFSKYPIIKKESKRFKNGEAVLRADIEIHMDTISIFTTHLESFRFSKEEFKKIDIANASDNLNKKNTRGILSKLKNKLKVHSDEAKIVADFIQLTNYPLIFSGDLNEVANNHTYWAIRGNKQDAFLEKGFGFGKTYNSLKNNLRIDYIMPDTNFVVTQFNIVDDNLSDHKMLVSDVVLKKYQTKK